MLLYVTYKLCTARYGTKNHNMAPQKGVNHQMASTPRTKKATQTRNRSTAEPGTEILWLKVSRAKKLFDLSESELHGLIKQHKIIAFRYRGLKCSTGPGEWRISYKSLCEYFDDQMRAHLDELEAA